MVTSSTCTCINTRLKLIIIRNKELMVTMTTGVCACMKIYLRDDYYH